MTIITEAATFAPEALTGKTWRVKLIEGDRQGSSAYYPKEVLAEGKDLFKKGTRIFMNHRAEGEPPSRDAEKIIGWFTEDAEHDGKDLFTNVHIREDKQALIKELAEGGVIGMSISAEGKFKKGTKILESFTKVHSVDVVSVPGAGGGFSQMLEAEASDGTAVPGSEKEELHMDPKELAAALAEALAPKFEELTEALKPAAPAEPLEEATPEPKAKTPLKEFMAKLNEAELTETAREAVVESYEADGDWAKVLEAETKRDAEIRESAKPAFKGAVHVEESGSESLVEALKGVWA
jgi:hypothetical protein